MHGSATITSQKSAAPRGTPDRGIPSDRITFLRTELPISLALLGLVETERNLGDPEHAARSLEHAERAYVTLVHFMSEPKPLPHMTEDERVELSAGNRAAPRANGQAREKVISVTGDRSVAFMAAAVSWRRAVDRHRADQQATVNRGEP
jgi:hypothetical protein